MSDIGKDDGGPAFPIERQHALGGTESYLGMTLRDYFAAQALAGGYARDTLREYELEELFGKHRTGIRREEILAADAYRLADAMIARRSA